METIMSLNTYNTDIYGTWGIGQTKKPISWTFENVLNYTIGIKANVIVKPPKGKYWYIKGINNNKTYEDIKIHLETNINSGYKENSRTWLISYL